MSATPALTEKQNLVEVESARSLSCYEERLKPLLEPQQNGLVVAIQPDTSDYAVARTASEARRSLRLRQPRDFILTRTIGPETRQSLVRRALAAHLETKPNS